MALLLVLALALGAGAGLARAGVIEVEGEVRLHIRPAPTCVIKGGPLGGPYVSGPFYADEPATLEFNAWGLTDPNGGTLTVEWDFTYDTVQFNTEATGTGPVSHTYADGRADTLVAARLTSSIGAIGYVIQRVIIDNVPPSVNLNGPYSGQPGVAVNFAATASDVSAADVAAGLHFAWDFDYSPDVFTTEASGFGLTNASHTYAVPDDYVVALRVTDKDGGSTLVTATVTVRYNTAVLNFSSVADTYLNQDAPTNNYGSDTITYVKADDSGYQRRTLVKFDLAGVPANATIVSATLKLYADSVPGIERTHGAHSLTSAWSESTVKWSTAPSSEAAATGIGFTPAAPGWVSWNVTADVQDYVDAAATNFGWLIRDVNENAGSGVTTAYDTREYADATKRPVLIVEYAVP
ncbi:MAG: DNRLRE domain-containing protein [Chloroflexi bacterium]|nr:DNRLRE domain-containing protein [Chloroflexota bacterium]